MRLIVACIIVVGTVLAVVALIRTSTLTPPPSVVSNAAAPKPAMAPKPVPPSDPVANVAPVSAVGAVTTSAPAIAERLPALPPSAAAAEPTDATSAQEFAPPETGAPTPAGTPAAPQPVSCPGNPDALGVSRTVQIDTTGGPGFGFEHFKQHDFLKHGEVVLTFDDGPWPGNTPAVLAALARHCLDNVFPDRQARHLPSGNPPAGCSRGSYDWIAHLVARGPGEEIVR